MSTKLLPIVFVVLFLGRSTLMYSEEAATPLMAPIDNQKTLDIEPLQPETPPKEEWITIFVHGSVGTSLCLKYFSELLRENICHTRYYRKTINDRCQPSWTRHHAAQNGLGLQKIDMEHTAKTAAQLFAILYGQVQQKYYPERKTLAYYTFDWSGAINHNERYKAGKQLYYELKELVKNLKHESPSLKIQAVGYSHGGNVLLNMIPHHEEDPAPIDFDIEELIMIATPTQRETDCHALHDLFKNRYAIYSRADCVQKMDCFSLSRLFSGRKFKDTSRCSFGDCIQHIELKITVAVENDLKLSYPSKKRIDRSPGHIELWYFAQLCECPYGTEDEYCLESQLYRYYFPLEPLPAAILTPALVKTAQERPCKDLIVEVQPDTGKAILREAHQWNKETIDFITPEEFDDMKTTAMPYLTKNAAPARED